jgi:hypothetical protein
MLPEEIDLKEDGMRGFIILAAALVGGVAAVGPAQAAGICRTASLSCATTMPIGGYCECTAHGRTQDGTVAERVIARHGINATAAGCGAHPNAPGCR